MGATYGVEHGNASVIPGESLNNFPVTLNLPKEFADPLGSPESGVAYQGSRVCKCRGSIGTVHIFIFKKADSTATN